MVQRPAQARVDVEAPHDIGGVAIRPATAADVAALVALENAAFPGDRLSRRSIVRFLRRPTARFLVASFGGRVAGYLLLLLHARRRAARLYSVAVAEGFAGRGVGRALIEAGCEAARSAGRDSVTLEVRVDNARAIELYRRSGFSANGRIENYYEDGAPAHRMVRSVAGPAGTRP